MTTLTKARRGYAMNRLTDRALFIIEEYRTANAEVVTIKAEHAHALREVRALKSEIIVAERALSIARNRMLEALKKEDECNDETE